MYEKYAKRRDELGLTDYKVAKMSGVLTCALSEWKKYYETDGKSGYQPKLEKISAIASALGMNVADFLERGGTKMRLCSIDDLKGTLYQQLQLLAERSKKEDISVKELCDISNEMNKLVSAIYGLSVRSI